MGYPCYSLHVLRCRYVVHFYFPFFHSFPDEVITQIYVLGTRVELIVLRQGYRGLVICHDGEWIIASPANFINEHSQPDPFLCCMGLCDILCLCARQRNDGLLL